ncbi:hypothetical protein [Acinetobacter baretiae]|uniref:hypothetical protein n=1 Tax=Acinetobacter baretiae TaxID=2605383 RepID=UPI001F408E16|nr:hypothetical protein [Acinetobacter baretiae]
MTKESTILSDSPSIDLTPQQILQIPKQDMHGQWSVEKWEYWFRHSDLSPAIQNLASYGTMSGEIDGVSIFHIPNEYEKILQEHQADFEQVLLKTWPNTHFSIEYGTIEGMTAAMLQEKRKQKAYRKAQDMLETDPVIKSLLSTFDANIEDIQLK